MAWLNDRIPFQVAVERGWTTYDLYLSNWNLTGTAADTNSLQFPNPLTQANIPSPFGVGIGPFSDIDRVRVQYTTNIDITAISPVTFFNVYNQKWLSVHSPIMYPVAAPIRLLRDSFLDTPNNFTADDGSGTSVPFAFGSGAGLAPRLHVIFYLQPPALIPSARYPRVDTYLTPVIGTGVTQLQRVIPIFGRKTINVTCTTLGGNITWRIGLISYTGAAGANLQERTAATFATVAANAVATTTINPTANAGFLSVWATANGAPSNGTAYVEAIDG